MGGQAALPDLNTQWIINTREFWTAIKQHNYQEVFGSLFSVNALLPKEYQIEISDIKYNKEISKQGVSIICKHCNAEHRHEDIKVKVVNNCLLVNVITKQTSEKVWNCNKCNQDNILNQTKMIEDILPDPCYLKVIPSPPNRKDGILHRRTYEKSIEKWAMQFFNELQHQMSLFRLQYKPKDEDMTEAITEGGEELDGS